MKTISFAEQNYVYPAKREGDESGWGELPALVDHAKQTITSVWEPTLEERIAIAEGGMVELHILGPSQPPVSVSVYKVSGAIPNG